MLGFGKTKEKPKLSQAEAFEKFRGTVEQAIRIAQSHGVWPHTLSTYLEAHVNNLNMAQVSWR